MRVDTQRNQRGESYGAAGTFARRSFLTLVTAVVGLFPRTALADVGAAELAAKRARVISACRKNWQANSGDCSAFVKSVAADLGITLTGQADDICNQIAAPPWIQLGKGGPAAAVAGVSAGEGKFVVAGLAAPGNGHVAIVVDYRNAFDSYSPLDRDKAVSFWGKLHSAGKEFTRITLSWTADDLKNVTYAYRVIP